MSTLVEEGVACRRAVDGRGRDGNGEWRLGSGNDEGWDVEGELGFGGAKHFFDVCGKEMICGVSFLCFCKGFLRKMKAKVTRNKADVYCFFWRLEVLDRRGYGLFLVGSKRSDRPARSQSYKWELEPRRTPQVSRVE